MISFVRGTVVHAGADSVVVDLGSVGVRVQCTPSTALTLRHGEHVELMTTMVVREDGWTLYGFVDDDERSVFEQTQTVSGIGPRIALALLATLSPDELRRAVSAGDEATLVRVPGIGRKGAQRLILELADRLGPAGGGEAGEPVPAPREAASWEQSVVAGLASLGWSAREAEASVAALDPEVVAAATAAQPPDVGALLKAALRGLDRS
ncbi:MAG: Holliday junction branch migration protein RuvA [Actinomycetales bacterium]|nr:Holliday junction branch migration protein RuvA [Actinomycetales bacterium]